MLRDLTAQRTAVNGCLSSPMPLVFFLNQGNVTTMKLDAQKRPLKASGDTSIQMSGANSFHIFMSNTVLWKTFD